MGMGQAGMRSNMIDYMMYVVEIPRTCFFVVSVSSYVHCLLGGMVGVYEDTRSDR